MFSDRPGCDMDRFSTSLVLLTLGFAGLTIANRGYIELNCSHEVVSIQIHEYENVMKSLNAIAFLIGDIRGHSCTVGQSDGKIMLYFPFQLCGMSVKIHEGGVAFQNSLWAWTANKPIKYADIQCVYETEQTDFPTLQQLTLKHHSTGNPLSEVGLCKTPTHCPSGLCPAGESFSHHAVYFERDVMYLSVKMTGMKATQGVPVKAAAIGRLTISCGNDSSHAIKQYHSVLNGCRAYGGTYEDRKRTLYTQVEYNVQTDTICMGVDTPPSKECGMYYLHGTAVYCDKKHEQKCEDYSGSMCDSPGAERSEFTYGPIYVLPRTTSEPVISYYLKNSGPTTSPDIATTGHKDLQDDVEAKTNFSGDESEEILDVDRDQAGGVEFESPAGRTGHPKEKILTSPSSEIQQVPGVVTEYKVINEVVLPKYTETDMVFGPTLDPYIAMGVPGKRPAVSQTINPNVLIDPEQIAEEQAAREGLLDIATTMPNSERTDRKNENDIAPRVILSPTPPQSKKNFKTISLKTKQNGNDKYPAKNAGKMKGARSEYSDQNRQDDVIRSDSDLIIEDAILEIVNDQKPVSKKDNRIPANFNKTKKMPTDGKKDVLEIIPQESSLRKSALGVYDSGVASQGFIWGAIAALGVFLLASIGLLAAWTATRRKKAQRRKERRNW